MTDKHTLGQIAEAKGGVDQTADARLIAAAPAMLDALRALVAHDDHEDCYYCDAAEGTEHDPDARCGCAVAAIRAATGE